MEIRLEEKEFEENYMGEEDEALTEEFYENTAPAKFTLSIELITFYRSNPVDAANDLLGIYLVFSQRAMLNVMWGYPNVCEVLSRGMSKTFMLAVYAMLRVLLYSDITVGVVSKTYRQAQEVFNYVKEINARAMRCGLNFFQDQVMRSRTDAFSTELTTKHGSKMFAVPVGKDGDGGRGKRCHILLVDEAGIVPQPIVDKVVRAYLNVMPMNPMTWGKNKIATNQKIFCSSATYQWHWFYKEMCSYAISARSSDLYYMLMLDFRDFEADPRSPYNLDWEQIKDSKRATPKLEFKMEYMNFFIPEGQNFFSLEDLREIKKGSTDYHTMSSGREGETYFIVCDPAETAGGDNFAIGVFLLVEQTKEMVPVYLKKWNNGISMQEAAIFIRGLQFLFGAKMIVCDSKGGGAELIKQMSKTEAVGNTHASGNFPVLRERSAGKSNTGRNGRRTRSAQGNPIIASVKFSSQLIENMGWDLAYMIEQRRLVYPTHDITSPNPAVKETSELLKDMASEIANIQTKASGQYTGFTTRVGKKDFFTIAMMAAHWATKHFDGQLKAHRKKRGSAVVGIAAGIRY